MFNDKQMQVLGYDLKEEPEEIRARIGLIGHESMLYGDLIYMKFITEQSWNTGSALSIILLVFVLLSMTFMKKAERKTSDEGGGRLW